jgi:hypothetical protein
MMHSYTRCGRIVTRSALSIFGMPDADSMAHTDRFTYTFTYFFPFPSFPLLCNEGIVITLFPPLVVTYGSHFCATKIT